MVWLGGPFPALHYRQYYSEEEMRLQLLWSSIHVGQHVPRSNQPITSLRLGVAAFRNGTRNAEPNAQVGPQLKYLRSDANI